MATKVTISHKGDKAIPFVISKLKAGLERLLKALESKSTKYTDKKIQAAILYGPQNLKVEEIHEEVIREDQIRIDVHYCGVTGSDVLLWAGDHYRIANPSMILGFEVSGTIMEMGQLAYEKTRYQWGEEVVVHNTPSYGGFAESCLASYKDVFRLNGRVSMKNAAAAMDDYFTSLLTLGRRAVIMENEYFVINTSQSRSALAIIDIAINIFNAQPIIFCDNPTRAKICRDLGAVAAIQNDTSLPYELERLTGKREVRLIVDTEGGENFQECLECLKHEGTVAFLSFARNRKRPNPFLIAFNYTLFTVLADHYKNLDPLVYRETVEHVLNYLSEGVVQPRISAVFGLDYICEALNYYVNVPSGKVLIDMKNHQRRPFFCDTATMKAHY